MQETPLTLLYMFWTLEAANANGHCKFVKISLCHKFGWNTALSVKHVPAAQCTAVTHVASLLIARLFQGLEVHRI